MWANNTVTARQGLTYGEGLYGDYDYDVKSIYGGYYGNYGVNTVEPVKGIVNQNGNYMNGVVHCSWSRSNETSVKGINFDISSKKYYVFLAMGPILASMRLFVCLS